MFVYPSFVWTINIMFSTAEPFTTKLGKVVHFHPQSVMSQCPRKKQKLVCYFLFVRTSIHVQRLLVLFILARIVWLLRLF